MATEFLLLAMLPKGLPNRSLTHTRQSDPLESGGDVVATFASLDTKDRTAREPTAAKLTEITSRQFTFDFQVIVDNDAVVKMGRPTDC